MKNRRPEYDVWAAMIQRCTNPRNKSYGSYGGRGITICAEWRDSFRRFITDVGDRPSRSHTIERRNNDGHYAPDNCYWATREAQNNNRSLNVLLSFDGQTMTIAQWGRAIGVPYHTIHSRIRLGFNIARVLTPKTLPPGRPKLTEDSVREIRQLRERGETQTAIAKKFSVTQSTVRGILIGRLWKHVA